MRIDMYEDHRGDYRWKLSESADGRGLAWSGAYETPHLVREDVSKILSSMRQDEFAVFDSMAIDGDPVELRLFDEVGG